MRFSFLKLGLRGKVSTYQQTRSSHFSLLRFSVLLCKLKFGLFLFFSFFVFIMTIFIFKLFPESKGVHIEEMTLVWSRHPYWKKYVPSNDDYGDGKSGKTGSGAVSIKIVTNAEDKEDGELIYLMLASTIFVILFSYFGFVSINSMNLRILLSCNFFILFQLYLVCYHKGNF